MLARGAAEQIIAQYVDTGQVRYVFRHYPFLGEESYWAAEASECALEQGQFWEYHDKLFEEWRGENIGALSKPTLKRFAADMGLDAKAFNACLDSGKYEGKVLLEKVKAEEDLGVETTPTMFINDEVVTGNQPFEVYQAIIERELSTAP